LHGQEYLFFLSIPFSALLQLSVFSSKVVRGVQEALGTDLQPVNVNAAIPREVHDSQMEALTG
jgi:molybdenum cofactor biosynthesis enzyme MoaA